MFNLSEDQIAKLRKAIADQDSIAVLATLMQLFPSKHSGEFVATLATVGKQDKEHAEDLFGIAIVLYDRFFPEEHRGGLTALCGMAQLLDQADRQEQEIDEWLDLVYPLVIRAATALGKIDSKENNGKGVSIKVLRNICTDFDCHEL